jgi:hypothetical protein
VTRIAFLIERKTHYRLLGAVVEEALRRGGRVECWHDWSQSRTNWKGHDFPDLEPAFRSGRPEFIRFRGAADLRERFEVDPPDAVVCVDPPEAGVVGTSAARWFWLQFATDLVLHPTSAQGMEDATALGVFSPWWVKRLRQNFGEALVDAPARRKMVSVGMPMLDLGEEIDADEVRWTYGLPRDRPLVLYLPFPWRSCPVRPWVQRAAAWAPGAWPPHVAGAINRRLGPPRGDRPVVEALRAFCDRNGAALVVKSRLKDPSPAYLRRVAAAHFDEGQEGYHPPLILRLLRCASLCVHFYSAAVVEAVFCGVPSLCLGPAPEAMGLDTIPHATRLYHGREGGLYNWPGAAHWRSLGEAVAGLSRWGLADFPIEPAARKGYVERFLGWDDAKSSARFLDLVSDRVRA